ncbi:hypothetical protein BGW38_003845 [Lunasporangiospora selenospora]|uniref:Uncharacterized protein n=1 Tax=Lunasporangiospora selenospora TaxID=979761 RepID=A0A9P6G2K2_9FUNG|nr:hypothetical protein BGW38_003845 [Lunasporangiospora selenospora]
MSEQTTHRAKRSKPRTQYSDLGPETIETFPIATLGPTDPILDPSGRMHVLSGTDDQGSSISAMVKDIAPPSDIFPPREQRSGSLDDSAEAMSFGLEFLTDRDDYSRPPTIQHSASFEGLAVIGSIVQDASSNLQPGVAMEGLSSSLTNSKPKTKRQSQTQKIEEKTEIEIGESIQKSTIMVKRLRSKSESKKSGMKKVSLNFCYGIVDSY